MDTRAARRPLLAWRTLGRALAVIASMAWCLGCAAAETAAQGTNLLAGRRATRAEGVEQEAVLTDDVAAVAGDEWMTNLAARFRSPASYVEYDLGESRTISAAFLQGDANDEYAFDVSEDGRRFVPLWTAPAVSDGGQRSRFTAGLHGNGRYVRISPAGGDGHFSVTEVQVFAEAPPTFPPRLAVRKGAPLDELARGAILVFAAAVVALLLSTARFWRPAFTWSAAALVALAAYYLVGAARAAWPLGSLEVSLVRATASATAAVAIVSATWLKPRLRPSPRATTGVLGLCAITSLLAFFNLGHPQFIDHSTGRPSVIHNFDMRVYFPIAKYFEELRFDGLYLASVAAYADDGAGATLASLANTPLRDLDTLEVERVGDIEPRIRAVRERFSPERWAAFRRDMRYFRQTMGSDDYLSTLTDHGGNATPVWFSVARLLFWRADASNATLTATALLDPLLLLLMFVAIGRSFGPKTMLVSMIVFGANDFYMFGTNWAGATLRHDWLAFLGLGLCALKVGRSTIAGALLAMAALIRAFPALALAGSLVPFAWTAWDARRTVHRRTERFLREHPEGVRIAIGAAVCAFVLVLGSSLILSPAAWSDWLRKVSTLDRRGSTNEISLRALIAGNGGGRDAILAAMWPLRVIGMAAPVAADFAAGRGRPPHQAAILALLLVPVIFNPSNYYLHLVCLVPLLVDEAPSSMNVLDRWLSPRDSASWLMLLGMCAAQYWTVLERDVGLHFRFATVLYFGMLTSVLVNALRQNGERRERAELLQADSPVTTYVGRAMSSAPDAAQCGCPRANALSSATRERGP